MKEGVGDPRIVSNASVQILCQRELGMIRSVDSKSLLTKWIIIREVIPYIVGKVEKSLFEKKLFQDIEIFIWALLTNQDIIKPSFKASRMLIRKFKTANLVVSPMITSDKTLINCKN